MENKIKYITMLIVPIFLQISCKKFVEVDSPQGQLVTNNVFNNPSTAIAAVTSIYAQMFIDNYPYSIALYTGMSSDELKSYSSYTPFVQLYTNSLTVGSGAYTDIWNSGYSYIFQANQAIEGLQNSSAVDAAIKAQLTGEAKFIRAFWHFYLCNLFGNIPIVVTTNYSVNAGAGRKDISEVYQQIAKDLNDAKSLLSNDFIDANNRVTNERVRPTKWAAIALLARAYLYMGDYANAEKESTSIIGSSNTFSLSADLSSVFLSNSSEAIWQLLPVMPQYNTQEGHYFILTASPSNGSGIQTSAISSQLLASFEPNDQRKVNWVGNITVGTDTFYYPYKYKIAGGDILTEYSMVLRLAEQYLIRAEARVQQDNLEGAQADLNIIRTRAGLGSLTFTDKNSILAAILHERQVELFTEWGHRWLDLKRTGHVDETMSVVTPLKGGTWNQTDELYPIPQSDRDKNPNLSQNPGY